jgi:hypothetical protein
VLAEAEVRALSYRTVKRRLSGYAKPEWWNRLSSLAQSPIPNRGSTHTQLASNMRLRSNSRVACSAEWQAWTGPLTSPAVSSRSRDTLSDVAPEYAAAAERYIGEQQGQAWVAQLRGQAMGRIRIVPEWVNIIAFETRLPSALTP